MAGDHKCPVCSSTFTRPQHVARHMRSHTGDRPYKCTHCGDQFARSDLLSRHVNKCHASEKPPTTTQPARRKGHAQPGSSSQGGVRGPAPPLIPPPGSRKICDPCAHSRTPAQCDSGLPCGKCLQRNTKCTYIKANEARRASASSSASVPLQRPHDLFSAPGAPLTVPSMARSDPGFPTQPAFNFTVPLYPQSLDPRSAASLQPFDSASPHPPSLTLSASTSESVESSGLYDTTHFSLRCSNQPQLGHPPAPGQGFTNQALAMPPHMVGAYPDGRKSSQAVDAFLNQSYTAGGELPPYLYGNPPGTDPNLPGLPHPQQMYGFNPADVYYDARAHDQPDVGSDFAFAQHVPGEAGFPSGPAGPHHGGSQDAGAGLVGPGLAGAGSHDGGPGLAGPGLAPHPGEFSSAFGLMSLDDPAKAAEMTNGASFFAPGALDTKGAKRDLNINNMPPLPLPNSGRDANMSLPTIPTPGSMSIHGRDANIAELRDFWKAFMRDHTPGEKTPNSNGVFNINGSAIINGGGSDRPGMRRSLSKMTSLPDIKTPPVDAHLHMGPQHNTAEELARGHGQHAHIPREDLRSYEQAVLARQAPSLTLAAPRKRATFPTNQQQQGSGYPAQHQSPSYSNASSTSTTASPQPQPQDEVRERPSFKRLASQTLGPFETKSVKVSHRDGAAADAIAVYESGGGDPNPIARYESGGRQHHDAGGRQHHQHPHHHVRSPSGEYPPAMHERDRRLSAPTASVTRPAFAPQ